MATTSNTIVRWDFDAVHTVLYREDIAEYMFTKKHYNQAQEWIKSQGYHLWKGNSGVGIRLEKTQCTIISVVVHGGVHYCRDDIELYPIIDTTCYAAMLLYQRLKRDNVIA